MENDPIENLFEEYEVEEKDAPEVLYEKKVEFRKSQGHKNKKYIKYILFGLAGALVLAGLLVLLFTVILKDKYDDSAAFYFTSDMLTEEGGRYVSYDDIEFSVYNYADELRISKEKIKNFTITVKVGKKDITNKCDISMGETSFRADIRSESEVNIKVPEKYKEEEIKVIAVSEPIEKELSATFDLQPAWSYKLDNDQKGKACLELSVYANKDTKLKFEWNDKKVTPDTTNEFIYNLEEGKTTCTIRIKAGESVMIPLFKNNITKKYEADDIFKLTEEVAK